MASLTSQASSVSFSRVNVSASSYEPATYRNVTPSFASSGTRALKSSSDISVRATPTTANCFGSWPRSASRVNAGYSLRDARSPVAPNTTSAAEGATRTPPLG